MYATLIDTRARKLRDEGWSNGWRKGWNEGWEEAQMEIFRNLIASGMPREDAMRFTEIREELAESAMKQPTNA